MTGTTRTKTKKNKRTVVGIDYSMSSPAICVHVGDEWSIDNCKFYFLTQKKKCVIQLQHFHGDYQFDFSTQQERFEKISSWAVDKIPDHAEVFIEGYAYASKGVVFHIGENTGLLKHKLWSTGAAFVEVSPPAIKKFATGKGTANKLAMYESFVADTQMDISSIIHCNEGDSPMSDVIDAYYVAKFGFTSNGA